MTIALKSFKIFKIFPFQKNCSWLIFIAFEAIFHKKQNGTRKKKKGKKNISALSDLLLRMSSKKLSEWERHLNLKHNTCDNMIYPLWYNIYPEQ